jgi:site-specific DNA-methyltransferase (adenine-specific)
MNKFQSFESSSRLKLNTIYNEDCLIGMEDIPDKSIDMILCDLPYGTTACKWDIIIPIDKLWKQYERIIKDNGAIVLTSIQPFTSQLILSNPNLFKQELIWLKTRPSNFMNAKKMFMNWHENVLIFYKKLPTFNRQMIKGKLRKDKIIKVDRTDSVFGKTGEQKEYIFDNNGLKNPTTVIEISNPNTKSLHPTQKPVELFEYLIKTYSNEGDIILDNCMGSGTTAEACINTNRNFLGFENDTTFGYFDISISRISAAMKNINLKNME